MNSYRLSGKKSDWDLLFLGVQKCCGACVKKNLRGVYREDVEELTVDATCMVMRRLERTQDTPKNWANFCYPYALKVLYGAETRKQDVEMNSVVDEETMGSLLRKFKRTQEHKIKKVERLSPMGNGKPLRFDADMYGNPYGSVAVCWFIFNKRTSAEIERVNNLWLEIKKDPTRYIDFEYGDEFFIEKTLKLFGLPFTRKLDNRLCWIKDKYGAFVCPCVNGVAMPNREDFFLSITYRNGEIKQIGKIPRMQKGGKK